MTSNPPKGSVSDKVTQAVFLVGGRGTRLGDIAQQTPKPLLMIEPGLRFLDVLIEEAARHGFDDILLLAGHKANQVVDAYDGKIVRDARIRVICEPEPQGTGGALRLAADRLADRFLMANGDSLFEFNLRALTAQPLKGLARLALRRVPDAARFGAVEFDGRFITAFREKDVTATGPAIINGGVYLIDRRILDIIPGPSSMEKDVFPQLVAERRLEGEVFDGYFLDMGLPETYAQARAEVATRRRRPCAFLDRDGVLNVDDGYTFRPGDLRWIDGAREAVRTLNDSGYFVIVVSNQAGVAKGFYTEEDVKSFHAEMSHQLATRGAHIDAFYFCPHHPDGIVERYRAANHPERKPNPGMLVKAISEWPIDVGGSFLVGDRQADLDAAAAAGLPGFLFNGAGLDRLVQSVLDHAPHKRV
ncbi:MAG: HAD-IIIA family hydrolase [Novosphingobium sp.]|nr:HAD-IIIA family hydrolase [Novosphingobium sp.]